MSARFKQCEQEHLHTPCPHGYIAWHAWAEQMAMTHVQERCPSCGLLAIWVLSDGDGEQA